MDLTNAGRFDAVVNSVFSALADAFPQAIDLDPETLGIAEGPAYLSDVSGREKASEHFATHFFAASCMRFLLAEGYISGTVHHTWAATVVLTAKGLEQIGGLPMSLRSA
ncbi:hypothetical protein [Pseudomonas sp. AM14(2022)]|jgi:hypothetical protein|uniref:hypothetical protein n=1 Tax=Pseudomonas sp. AM14(2022) TaxID=2983371 RepID=UPI002E80FCCF|nr:hypothetical protein [Pseudomonas sp. AM14(2022)]